MLLMNNDIMNLGGGYMDSINVSKSQAVYDLLKQGLDTSSLRSKVIANNISNLNTEGYKRYYVSFEDALKEKTQDIEMKTTKEKHMKDNDTNNPIKVEQDTTTSTRQDGNNVDLDNEMVNQAANNLMYDALVSQINNKISLEKYVIKEGR